MYLFSNISHFTFYTVYKTIYYTIELYVEIDANNIHENYM